MVAQSHVARLLDQHVTLDVRGIDRLYLNAYQPKLQTAGSIVYFFKQHRQHRFASTTLMAPMTREFVAAIEAFAGQAGLELQTFPHGQRQDTIAQRRLASLRQAGTLGEGVCRASANEPMIDS